MAKTIFLVNAFVVLLVGAPLLVVPGAMLTWLGWAPIDPLVSWVLGAALLAMAWSSFQGWQATEQAQVSILMEMKAIFTVLACVGLLRHLLVGEWPMVPWLALALFATSSVGFGMAWVHSLVRKA